MPKLQHNFVQGKMNKDLDERIVPNGQYRDALNIQVSNSEGSDVGAIENVLGNTKQNKKTSSLNWDANFGLTSPQCIGVARDTLNDKIYWFITATNGDAILEYDQPTGFIVPIIVDTRSTSILNFSTSYKITGINILDNMLFWTDNNNEPRKLNISDYKTAAGTSVGASATSLAGTSKTTEIYSRDFLASDITVIKPSPKQAVSITSSATALTVTSWNGSAEAGELGVGINPIIVNADFTDSNDFVLKTGNTKAISWGVNQSVQPLNAFNNKNVVLTHEALRSDGTKIKYEVIGTLSSLQGVQQTVEGVGETFYTNATLTIISATPDIPATVLSYEMVVDEGEPIFKNNFPRFSYRWKYVDGEYSTYAPFSKAAFVTGKFSYEPENGYNLGMDNNIRKITLTFPTDTYATPPKDVEEIEILYKGVDSNNIYVLDKHKTASGALSTFEITKDLLGPVVESLQLLRLFDDVPRKAKSQEIIGNRLVYGNYVHNYPFNDTGLAITGSSSSTALSSGEEYYGFESVKTDRTYQIGVSFLDEFSRESPVFTTKNAAVKLGIENAAKKNSLRASVTVTNAPTWASYYKFYVKDPSSEYYNIVLDRYYLASDGNAWFSFPSAERNKVREGNYITLKKRHGYDESVSVNNKYKILDIKNEAPDFIRRTNQATAISEVEVAGAAFSGKSLQFTGPTPKDSEYFVNAIKGGNTLQLRSTDGVKTSEVYKIANGGPMGDAVSTGGNGGQATNLYKIELANGEGLSDNDAWASGLSAGSEVEILIYDQSSELLPEFQGKFFVKVPVNSSFNNDIVQGQREEEIVKVLRTATGITATHTVSTSDTIQKLAYGGVSGDSSNPNNGPDDTSTTFDLHLYSSFLDDSDPGNSKIFPDIELVNTFNAVKQGVRVRFKNSNGNLGETYLITNVNNVSTYTYTDAGSNTFNIQKKTLTVDRAFDDNLGADPTELQVVDVSFGSVNAVKNPGIFETEQLELADLDIYYEASDALEIGSNAANLSNTVTLDFKNCYTFGNGVESTRIRDDFNAPQKGKGVRVSTTLQTPYYEEHLPASLIYSGIVNSRAGINNSNQFTTAIDITKDLPNTYGGIQKLHARDTDLIALCEDKCFRILANKDALFNADGNTNVTSSSNVLGQTVPYAGEFGISKNPETFASYGFRTYFTDKARGTVLRLSADGLTEIANAGMTDYFEDKFKSHSGAIIGSYDEASGTYNISFSSDESVAFKESVSGWPTLLSFTPEFAVSLNNEYYTIKNGELWEHSNSTRSNFYGTQEDTTVTLIINDGPSSIKNFKTLGYEGDEGWTATIDTDQQDGTVSSWQKREGFYYNFISGKATTVSNMDTSELAVQGLGELSGASAYSSPGYSLVIDGELNVSLQIGDTIYRDVSGTITSLGAVSAINRTTNTVTTTSSDLGTIADNTFIFFVKDTEKNTSGLVGYYGETKMSTSSGSKKELFAVNSEVFISSE